MGPGIILASISAPPLFFVLELFTSCFSSKVVLSVKTHACFLLVHLLPQSAFNVTVFYILLLLLFSLKKSSLLFTQNVGHFVLFMLFTCS